MITLPGNGKVSGITLIELIVVIAVVAILIALLLPAKIHSGKSRFAVCMNNQRQIAIAMTMFQTDHDGKNPWQVSTTNGGSMELVSSYQAFLHYRVLSNYFGNNTRQFVCPADTSRHPAKSYVEFANTNISYFLNLDVVTNLHSIWNGDRFLEVSGKPIKSGIFDQSTNIAMKWSAGFHSFGSVPAGFFLFADGHTELIPAGRLNLCLQQQPLATNRFCFP